MFILCNLTIQIGNNSTILILIFRLNDSFKFSEENGKLPTPSRKTIRDKISNKILASKEKRREKEMNEAKRRESKDNIEKVFKEHTHTPYHNITLITMVLFHK